MTSIYYVPKKPLSIPLFNPETQSYTLFFDDGEVDIPAELFFKLYKQEEREEESFSPVEDKLPNFENLSIDELRSTLKEMEGRVLEVLRAGKQNGLQFEYLKFMLHNDSRTKKLLTNEITENMFDAYLQKLWDKATL